MKTSKTTKPLYQRLNEERTQGEWEYNGVTKIMCNETIIFDGIRCFEGDRIYDAKYAEIAVNNLHHLAEVLNDFYVIAESMARYPDKYPEWDSEKSKERFKKLEEALNRIS